MPTLYYAAARDLISAALAPYECFFTALRSDRSFGFVVLDERHFSVLSVRALRFIDYRDEARLERMIASYRRRLVLEGHVLAEPAPQLDSASSLLPISAIA